MLGGLQYISKCCGNHNHVQKSKIEKLSGPEAVELLDKTARKMDPKIAQAFLDAMEGIRDRVNASQVASLLEQGRVDEVLAILSPELTEDALQGLQSAISQAVLDGGHAAAISQPPVIGVNSAPVSFVFNATNPELARYAQQITSTRIREISNGVREVARNVITEGVIRGDNPITTARKLRDTIGLTAKQSQAVDNYRRALENLDSNALKRGLRDRRSDGVITRAISNDKPLTPKQIESLVERYRKRYIKYRSNVIGRTESIRSVQGAQHALFQSYIDQGRIKEEQVRRFWHYTQDERTRNAHIQIPSMNEKGVGQNEPFQTPLGPLMFPGDPNGTVENVVQCRCACFVRVISLELLEPSKPPVNVVRPVKTKPKKKPKKPETPLRPIDVFTSNMTKRDKQLSTLSFSEIGEKLAGQLAEYKSPKKITLRGKKSWYRQSDAHINMGKASVGDIETESFQRVYRHEYGHHLDAMIANKLKPELEGSKVHIRYASQLAIKDVAADGRVLMDTRTEISDRGSIPDKELIEKQLGKVKKTRRKILDHMTDRVIDNGESTDTVVRSEFSKRGLDFDFFVNVYGEGEMLSPKGETSLLRASTYLGSWDEKDHAFFLNYDRAFRKNANRQYKGHAHPLAGLSDSIQAATAGDFGYLFGHENSYWKPSHMDTQKNSFMGLSAKVGQRFMGDRSTTQAFANWIEAMGQSNQTQKAFYRHFLPRTYAAFEKLLDGVLP